MQWDEYSFDPGSYGFDAGSYGSEYGSYDPSSYAGYTPDAGTGMSAVQGDSQYSPASGMAGGGVPPGGGMGAPGAQGLFGGGQMGGLNTLQGVLGVGGGLAGLIGALTGGGQVSKTMPQLGTAQTAQINQANQALQPAAQGQLPLQQMQASMLQALASGQIPPEMAKLVQSAYDPAYQDAATRSVNAGRQAGFFDNPLSSPPGGAIMGPAAAQLQGQQANSLLGLMQSLPQLFNAPVGNQIGAAQSQSGNLLQAANLGRGQTTSQPLGPQIGGIIGGGLQGMSQAIGQGQQQNSLNQLLQNQMQGQGGVNTGNYYGG